MLPYGSHKVHILIANITLQKQLVHIQYFNIFIRYLYEVQIRKLINWLRPLQIHIFESKIYFWNLWRESKLNIYEIWAGFQAQCVNDIRYLYTYCIFLIIMYKSKERDYTESDLFHDTEVASTLGWCNK